jgi:hypothetical protein
MLPRLQTSYKIKFNLEFKHEEIEVKNEEKENAKWRTEKGRRI